MGSSQNIHKRWIKHKYKLNAGTHHNKHLGKAWIKYGEAAFNITVLEECSISELYAIELKWFKIKGIPNHKYAYNILSNPRGGVKKRAVRQYDVNGTLINTYESTTDAVINNIKCTTEGISSCCNFKYKTHRNYIWRWESDKLDYTEAVKVRKQWSTLYLFDVETDEYQIFESVKKLSDKTSIKCETVYKLLHGKNMYTEKYIIVAADEIDHAITLYEKKREELNEYKERLMDTTKMVHNSIKKRVRPVIRIEDMKEFDSLKSGADSVGVTSSTILSVLQGKTKTAGGYTWKYK